MRIFFLVSILFIVESTMLTIHANDIVFGKTITAFKIDTNYHSETDGILYLQHNSSHNNLYLQVYMGNTEHELVKVAEVRWFGTITIPVQKGKYWRIAYNNPKLIGYVKDLNIQWTPVYGCGQIPELNNK